jgi:hypothetical protein
MRWTRTCANNVTKAVRKAMTEARELRLIYSLTYSFLGIETGTGTILEPVPV